MEDDNHNRLIWTHPVTTYSPLPVVDIHAKMNEWISIMPLGDVTGWTVDCTMNNQIYNNTNWKLVTSR